MKTTDELKELADEVVSACFYAQSHPMDDPWCNPMLVASAAAKGRLLLHKLGSFGSIWSDSFSPESDAMSEVQKMYGNALEILDALSKGRLSSIEEKASAAVLGDLVEHAEVLLEKKFNLAAAVVLRAVLEERLRKLCESHTLSVTAPKPTMEHFRQALIKADVIDKLVAKKIDWMAGVGNSAAHNLPTFNPADVPDLYKSTLDFLERFSV